MPSVLIIQPDAEDPPELLAGWLEDEGIDVRLVRPYAGEVVPDELVEDALVVLGGDMGANDVHAFPWLADVMALLRIAVSMAAPTLGICLGGQLLAASLGGRVEPGASGMEAGAVVVHPRAGAEGDVLLANLSWPLSMITMHRDAITALPPDAVWLAESEAYGHQVFRVGTSAWGVQFHPEVSPSTYASWATYITDTGEALQRVVDGVETVMRHERVISVGAEQLARSFAKLVADRIGP